MTNPRLTVLVVGATGSIGRLVVEEALREGHAVHALATLPQCARDPAIICSAISVQLRYI
jgi:NAD(P)-dependent dehydrogenase (short-subunit alcohol dehydrogenase family)